MFASEHLTRKAPTCYTREQLFLVCCPLLPKQLLLLALQLTLPPFHLIEVRNIPIF